MMEIFHFIIPKVNLVFTLVDLNKSVHFAFSMFFNFNILRDRFKTTR